MAADNPDAPLADQELDRAFDAIIAKIEAEFAAIQGTIRAIQSDLLDLHGGPCATSWMASLKSWAPSLLWLKAQTTTPEKNVGRSSEPAGQIAGEK
jgi:hypothetical protein